MDFLRALMMVGVIVLNAGACKANEVSLFDALGEAVAYVDIAGDFTIYLWSGEPVAYLDEKSGGSINVFGFNGKHLGWFRRGAVWNKDGNAACATERAFSGLKHLEGVKSSKQLKPLKSAQMLSSPPPRLSTKFGKVPCAIYLQAGSS